MIINRHYQLLIAAALTAPLLSCGEGGTGKLAIDPQAASAKAMELLDKNADGLIDPSEMKASPALAEGIARVDTNSDGKVSSDELATRIQHWNNALERLVCPQVEVRLKGRLLPFAKVTFEPEPFLSEWLQPKLTKTDEMGRCTPQISRELPGMNMGYYRVKVSKTAGGKERVPANFNESTELGVEFCDDRPIDEAFLIPLNLGNSKRR